MLRFETLINGSIDMERYVHLKRGFLAIHEFGSNVSVQECN